tara:strand:+ start:336 stop:506 length:171 start_codon:yes stop_codon:yes gene_type:complete
MKPSAEAESLPEESITSALSERSKVEDWTYYCTTPPFLPVLTILSNYPPNPSSPSS